MNLMPAKIGAEPKKVAVVLVLLAVAAYFYISNRNSGESDAPSRSIAPTAVSTAPAAAAGQRAGSRGNRSSGRGSAGNNPREFRPSMKPPKGVDPSATDPTLHLNALAKLQDVKLEATTRSLFEISATPPVALTQNEPAKIKLANAFHLYGPPPPPADPPKPPTPRAPAIPLKFYGFVNPTRPDVKHAFFLDNDEIIVAGEGDLIKKRYKILRIGVNSAEVEDTTFKGDNTKQTLPLETELQG
jgi:hypothetical protein